MQTTSPQLHSTLFHYCSYTVSAMRNRKSVEHTININDWQRCTDLNGLRYTVARVSVYLPLVGLTAVLHLCTRKRQREEKLTTHLWTSALWAECLCPSHSDDSSDFSNHRWKPPRSLLLSPWLHTFFSSSFLKTGEWAWRRRLEKYKTYRFLPEIDKRSDIFEPVTLGVSCGILWYLSANSRPDYGLQVGETVVLEGEENKSKTEMSRNKSRHCTAVQNSAILFGGRL
ncbi:hypothetical protein F2P81_005843 [Scophthalmus maximus]|uniref:Uncharacterized protein n=1 Tax=Scophthalmus maximus TaxID=52904 RepID=A0A6A4THJ0_SCOMX|nr:hypothetical protein F2P81_005843 [Scophthalmus maximus]